MGATATQGQELVVPADVPPSLNAAARLLTRDTSSGLFKLGPFDFYPRASFSVYHDDNINITSSNELSDVVWTLVPGFALEARSHSLEQPRNLILEYSPVLRFFLDNDQLDSIDHAARISGLWSGLRARLGVDQSFLVTSQPNADVGTRTDQFSYATRLHSEWDLGYKTSLDVDAAFAAQDYDDPQLTSSRDWSNSDWLNYRLRPKLSVGIGFVFGYLDMLDGPANAATASVDQTYQQLRVRAVSFVTDKLNLRASGGVESRQYRGGIDDTLQPVWDLTVTYQAWRKTVFSFTTFQRYSNSALSGDQNYLSTGVLLSITQRIFDRLALNVTGNYSRADYESTAVGGSSNREDDLLGARVSLDAYLTPHWTAGIYYSYDRDDSNDSQFSYDRNQFGLQSGWRF